jgi:uncharacterized protein YbjT (DUF2867 family)
MRGARAAFFVTANGADELTHGLNVVDAAREAGLERLVYSSAWRFWSRFAPLDRALSALTGLLGHHYRAKLDVAARVPNVVLRPTNFFQNDRLTETELDHGRYLQPLGGKRVNRVDVRDIALAAARAVEGELPDGAYPLVGPRSLTGPEATELWSRALGRPLAYEGAVEPWCQHVATKMDAGARDDWAKTFRLIRRFGLETPAGDVAVAAAALGRAPRTYEAWVEEEAARLYGRRASSTAMATPSNTRPGESPAATNSR